MEQVDLRKGFCNALCYGRGKAAPLTVRSLAWSWVLTSWAIGSVSFEIWSLRLVPNWWSLATICHLHQD